MTFVMWFMYEYTENEITELNQSYDTRLSEEEKANEGEQCDEEQNRTRSQSL